MNNSLTPVKWHLDGGRRFLGAGGQGSFSGILDSLDVGVVEHGSSSSSSASFILVFVFIGSRETREDIPVITHLLPSGSTHPSSCGFFEKPISGRNGAGTETHGALSPEDDREQKDWILIEESEQYEGIIVPRWPRNKRKGVFYFEILDAILKRGRF